ncbi:uncharacterized protein LOC111279163 [Durio zibethinus]|uniref:Uncharacterized protein LOC111279163 n=1 Tax=Durio zibethinus TaxID=66656 RepID=A0A6P5X1U3_DURZI|nr:uncharacterized protein LOC111279163 [Durio zibethinus]
MQDLSLTDHRFTGPLFTRGNYKIFRKLDRVLINDIRLTKAADSMVEFLASEVSDHYLALLKTNVPRQSPPKPFKFFNFGAKHPDFLKLVEESWQQTVEGNPMIRLYRKLKRLKTILRQFNFSQFGNLVEKVEFKREKLAKVQTANLLQSSSADIEKKKKLIQELHELFQAKESMLRQKSRIRWK